jgi:predicted RecA/RadA family phage recombinase
MNMGDDHDTIEITAARKVASGERAADASTRAAARVTLAEAGMDPATGRKGIFWHPTMRTTRVFGCIDKAEAKRILAAKASR